MHKNNLNIKDLEKKFPNFAKCVEYVDIEEESAVLDGHFDAATLREIAEIMTLLDTETRLRRLLTTPDYDFIAGLNLKTDELNRLSSIILNTATYD